MKSQKNIYVFFTLVAASVIGVITFLSVSGTLCCSESAIADKSIPIIYLITPTYARTTQIADLTRLINTLLHLKRLHWIVIEDAYTENLPVRKLLNSSKIPNTYLTVPKKRGVDKLLKGIAQRNAGLAWIREHHDQKTEGVFYFADDDNTYSLALFNEMRKTKKVSVWPVGFTSRMALQTPVVKNNKVVGFMSWASDYRKFAVDMAGFALNVNVLFDYPDMIFPYDCPPGYQETVFLEQCCQLKELEPMAENCSKVLVWHTRTQTPDTRKFIGRDDIGYLWKFYKEQYK